ncbi:conserved hypothetical protein [Trichinella spiralis]|uniref:hypothetical protein n=1 Tax=Trichinella spiralis TaxID=6334 RepID=UPI0001EFC71D|nr:conserved hypothetical protein [Trichinella spiralis]
MICHDIIYDDDDDDDDDQLIIIIIILLLNICFMYGEKVFICIIFQTLLISCPASGKCSFLWHCVEIDAFSPTVSYCTSWSFRKKMTTRRGEAKFSITKLIESASLENTPVVGRQSVAFLLKLFPNCRNSQGKI